MDILGIGLPSRIYSAVSEVDLQLVVSATVKGISNFPLVKFVYILHGAETGIFKGFSESLREDHPEWFVWIVRFLYMVTFPIVIIYID